MTSTNLAQNYTFNGKEEQKELGLNWLDFGARNYDASLGRWMNTDPLSEEFYSYSPYNAMMNNPLNFIDPTGMAAEWIPEVEGDTGAITYVAEKGDSAQSLSDQYGLTTKQAEKITGTKGDTEIKEGTVISGSKVEAVTGNDVLKLDIGRATDKDIVNQTFFAIRNERVNDNLWRNSGNEQYADYTVNMKDYFGNITTAVDYGAGGMFYGIGTNPRNPTKVTLDGQEVSVVIDFHAMSDGRFSTFVGKERYLQTGNTAMDILHPTAYDEGAHPIRNPVLTIMTNNRTAVQKHISN